MVLGSNPFDTCKGKGVVVAMKVVLHYRVNGVLRDWVCTYDRLNHILKVCAMKKFEVIGIEDLA